MADNTEYLEEHNLFTKHRDYFGEAVKHKHLRKKFQRAVFKLRAVRAIGDLIKKKPKNKKRRRSNAHINEDNVKHFLEENAIINSVLSRRF